MSKAIQEMIKTVSSQFKGEWQIVDDLTGYRVIDLNLVNTNIMIFFEDKKYYISIRHSRSNQIFYSVHKKLQSCLDDLYDFLQEMKDLARLI